MYFVKFEVKDADRCLQFLQLAISSQDGSNAFFPTFMFELGTFY
jgi:hypothetical protein